MYIVWASVPVKLVLSEFLMFKLCSMPLRAVIFAGATLKSDRRNLVSASTMIFVHRLRLSNSIVLAPSVAVNPIAGLATHTGWTSFTSVFAFVFRTNLEKVVKVFLMLMTMVCGLLAPAGADARHHFKTSTARNHFRTLTKHQPGKLRTVNLSRYDSCVRELRNRDLLVPIAGANPEVWKNSFFSSRGRTLHHAVDMRAPVFTPIRAADNGTIARLNTGRRGG